VRNLFNLDIKKEIISKRESGKSVGNLSAEYGMAKSSMSTVLKNKKEIKSTRAAKGISRLSSSPNMEQMETLISVD
jgi:Mor family transcriptional regulator